MISPLPKEYTGISIEVAQQLAPRHTDNVSSSKPLSAAALASWRLKF
jgi:hypothetical protein